MQNNDKNDNIRTNNKNTTISLYSPPCEFYFGRNKDKQNNIAVKKKQKQNKKQESKHHAYINMDLIKMIFQHRTQYQFTEIVSNPQ